MAKKRNRYRSDKAEHKRFLRTGIKAVFALLGATCVVLLLSAALAHSYFALLEAPWLRAVEVEISGLKHLKREDILNAMKVPCNANVLTLKTAELAAGVESLPWVKSAVVSLNLRGRIVVEVVERDPIAVVVADDFFLLDKEGRLFLRIDHQGDWGLLLVTGFSGMNLHEGDVLPPQPLEELRRLLPSIQKSLSWLPLKLITECSWRGDEGFVLFVTERQFPIQLGAVDPDQKFERLRRIWGMLSEKQWLDLVTRIDLDYPNRAFVEGRLGF